MLFPEIPKLQAMPPYTISFSSSIIPQGDVTLIKIKVKNGEIPHVTWMNKKIHLLQNDQKTEWYGFLGVDLTAEPGPYKVAVKIWPSGYDQLLNMKILGKDYGIRRLILPKNMVDLDARTLQRVKKEARIMKKLWEAPPSNPLWSGPFLRPISGEVVGPFGRRSIINNQPRSPHSGIDLKADRGTPVMAINNGRVVLTADHFFSGSSIVIDHGGGIQSMYFHLEKILVQQGQMVKKGDVIGLVGSTGRATGPHLHWGIRVNGARVDPLRFIDLSRQL